MNIKQMIAGATAAALLATGVPIAAAADGAASTRNIILGGAVAGYLIIQHNRKVHEKYAEDAQRQAATAQNANDAWAAYSAEKRAYENQVAANRELKREVAYQQKQLADTGMRIITVKGVPAKHGAKAQQVAMVSYGWGEI